VQLVGARTGTSCSPRNQDYDNHGGGGGRCTRWPSSGHGRTLRLVCRRLERRDPRGRDGAVLGTRCSNTGGRPRRPPRWRIGPGGCATSAAGPAQGGNSSSSIPARRPTTARVRREAELLREEGAQPLDGSRCSPRASSPDEVVARSREQPAAGATAHGGAALRVAHLRGRRSGPAVRSAVLLGMSRRRSTSRALSALCAGNRARAAERHQ
jgi:hypothetical protein